VFLCIQTALELIETVPALSPACSLLRCEVTLLLADVSSVTGIKGSQMVTVYSGLLDMIKKQKQVHYHVTILT